MLNFLFVQFHLFLNKLHILLSLISQRFHIFLHRRMHGIIYLIYESHLNLPKWKEKYKPSILKQTAIKLTSASLAGVELRKNTDAMSIAWSGMSRRNLSPISVKAANKATWSPCHRTFYAVIKIILKNR